MSDYACPRCQAEVRAAYAILVAARQKGEIAIGWRMSPKAALRVAHYYGLHWRRLTVRKHD